MPINRSRTVWPGTWSGCRRRLISAPRNAASVADAFGHQVVQCLYDRACVVEQRLEGGYALVAHQRVGVFAMSRRTQFPRFGFNWVH
jgi:hypothetical protein